MHQNDTYRRLTALASIYFLIVAFLPAAGLAQARCEVAWERRGLSGHNAANVNAMGG